MQLFKAIVCLLIISSNVAAKVVDFGPKLPEFIAQYPTKSWLIKFYAPWCYHCQQMEPTYLNVAAKIDHKHLDLIVGRVDCSKYASVCEQYEVRSFPTIKYLNQQDQIVYRGDRSESSLIDFAERVSGPDINKIDQCDQLRDIADRHGLVILSNRPNEKTHEVLKLVIASLKPQFWFYEINVECKGLLWGDRGIYMLKRHLLKPIKFEKSFQDSNDDLKRAIIRWIDHESHPIFGSLSSMNIERNLASGKPIIVAVLDEYKPARQFTGISRDFHTLVEKLVKRYAQQDNQLRFVWSSDLILIQTIAMRSVPVPNLMFLHPNYQFNILITDAKDLSTGVEATQDYPEKLSEHNLEVYINAARDGKLSLEGGDSYLHSSLRYVHGNYHRFISTYNANPLLASILVILPSLILLVVIYTTCCYDGSNFDDDAEDELGEDYDTEDDEQIEREDDDELSEQTEPERRKLLKSQRKHLKRD